MPLPRKRMMVTLQVSAIVITRNDPAELQKYAARAAGELLTNALLDDQGVDLGEPLYLQFSIDSMRFHNYTIPMHWRLTYIPYRPEQIHPTMHKPEWMGPDITHGWIDEPFSFPGRPAIDPPRQY